MSQTLLYLNQSSELSLYPIITHRKEVLSKTFFGVYFTKYTLDKIFLKYLLSYRKTFHHSATQKKRVEEFTKRNNCYYQIWLSLKIKANKNPKQTKIIHMKCHLFNFSESSTLFIQENLSSQICSSFHR